MYSFIYWCEILDEYDMKTNCVSGCTFATNYTDAMSNIEAYYGKSLLEIKLEMVDDYSVLEFKTYEEAKKIVSDV